MNYPLNKDFDRIQGETNRKENSANYHINTIGYPQNPLIASSDSESEDREMEWNEDLRSED